MFWKQLNYSNERKKEKGTRVLGTLVLKKQIRRKMNKNSEKNQREQVQKWL